MCFHAHVHMCPNTLSQSCDCEDILSLQLSIVKSPLAPPASLACRIQSKGIVVDWHATGTVILYFCMYVGGNKCVYIIVVVWL